MKDGVAIAWNSGVGRAAACTSGMTPAMAEELTLAQQELRHPGDGVQKGESL